MKITMPERRTVLFKDLRVGDFFIYYDELFRKIEEVGLRRELCEVETPRRTDTYFGVTYNNIERFDEHYGGEGEFGALADDAEVIPVDVEIKVSYQ